jgi:hypothetical protein
MNQHIGLIPNPSAHKKLPRTPLNCAAWSCTPNAFDDDITHNVLQNNLRSDLKNKRCRLLEIRSNFFFTTVVIQFLP